MKPIGRRFCKKTYENKASQDDIAYIEEDLRSPCTQEIAVFRAFARIVDEADDQVVVIDTAPTGHTLLLLDATQSYAREVERASGDVPQSVWQLLPRLRDAIKTAVINASLQRTDSTNRLLAAKASHEIEWINRIDAKTQGMRSFAFLQSKRHPGRSAGINHRLLVNLPSRAVFPLL